MQTDFRSAGAVALPFRRFVLGQTIKGGTDKPPPTH